MTLVSRNSQARSLSLMAALTLSSLALTACAGAAPEAEPAAEGAASSAAPAELTLYTSEPQEKIDQIIAAFNEEHPEIAVEVFRAGTGDLTARIAAEEKSGQVGADVLLAADPNTFEGYAARDLLLNYVPQDAAKLNPEVLDPEGFYTGSRIIPTVIAVNSSVDTSEITSWEDLTKPEYAGKLVMPNPDVSGAAAYNAAVWLNEDSLGEDWLTRLAANTPLIAESNGPVSQAIASGAQPVGIVVDYLVRDLAAAGSPIEAIYPEEGAPFVSQPVGIFANTEEPEAAKLLVDFLLSETGQQLAVEQAYLPVRGDVGSPEGAPALDDITLLTPNPDTIRDTQEAAVETFNELFQ